VPDQSASAVPVLEAHGITVQFGGLRALDDVDLVVAPSSTVGLVGPNGAGKTTLFGVMSGLLRPTAGEVRMDGDDVTRLSPQQRAHRGMARTFQRLELFVELTVREHLALAYRSHHSPQRIWSDLFRLAPKRDKAEDEVLTHIIDLLKLGPVADRTADLLPTGTGRLLEVARALAAKPRVLLLDEPSSGLDSAETEEFAEALNRVRQETGVAFVLVEHNVGLVLRLCATVTVLDFGRCIAQGIPDEIRSNQAVQTAYLGRVKV
jgi:ABC-type branched-subunit amino acid transport system ATPase component